MSHRAEEGVEDAGGEGPSAGEGLRHVERHVGVVLVVLVEKLHVVLVS